MKKIMITALAAAVALSFSACGEKVEKGADQTTAATAQDKAAVDAFGIVKANELKNILLDIPAVVEKVHVKEGQKVKGGDALITLDLSEYKTQIVNQELQLTSEQNDLNKLDRSYLKSSGSPELQKLQSDLKNAEDLYKKALEELESKQALYHAGSLAKSELDEFQKSVDAKKKTIDDIHYAISTTKYGKGLEADQKSSHAAILESELKLMKEKLVKPYFKENDIVSDISHGLVCNIGYVQGDKVSDQAKVLSILDLDSLVVEANVSEEFIRDVKDGAEVTIIPVADKSREYKGKVIYISGKAVEKNGETQIPVQISIENNDGFLLPDFNVDVKITAN